MTTTTKKTINKITDELNDVYVPTNALVTYRHMRATQTRNDAWSQALYVESFDIDQKSRKLINAHPLSNREAIVLSKTLYNAHSEKTAFLKPTGLLPANVLYIDPTPDAGKAIWYTPATTRKLLFVESLTIPSGEAHVPALIWKASKTGLTLFALPTDEKPTADTPMFQAPFFNVYGHGPVCMGSVNVRIKRSASLENFMSAWESYFFNSYFSHTIRESPINGNIVLFWQNQIASQEPFPASVLKATSYKVKDLIR
ncbi:PRTRC system protein B [Spirosoma fluviale]|uniref:PRTRC system protein B n=1 Tax=Spirosoma fluviale TaxID=1597977 RepID=A0A286FC74_9BACT|nr:PRTRC system protein B [Spirosoma fluviale]SOD80837.1 PRTRC system protein B [Spirosoma fluviale]